MAEASYPIVYAGFGSATGEVSVVVEEVIIAATENSPDLKFIATREGSKADILDTAHEQFRINAILTGLLGVGFLGVDVQ